MRTCAQQSENAPQLLGLAGCVFMKVKCARGSAANSQSRVKGDTKQRARRCHKPLRLAPRTSGGVQTKEGRYRPLGAVKYKTVPTLKNCRSGGWSAALLVATLLGGTTSSSLASWGSQAAPASPAAVPARPAPLPASAAPATSPPLHKKQRHGLLVSCSAPTRAAMTAGRLPATGPGIATPLGRSSRPTSTTPTRPCTTHLACVLRAALATRAGCREPVLPRAPRARQRRHSWHHQGSRRRLSARPAPRQRVRPSREWCSCQTPRAPPAAAPPG